MIEIILFFITASILVSLLEPAFLILQGLFSFVKNHWYLFVLVVIWAAKGFI